MKPNRVKKALDGCEKIMTRLGSFMLFMIVVLVNFQVITRYFFKFQLSWSIEACTHLLFFSLLLGATIAVRHASFASITLFISKFPEKIRLALTIINNILTVIFSMACMYGSFVVAEKARMTNLLLPASHIPQNYIYIGMAVCFILHSIYAIYNGVLSYQFFKHNKRMWKEGEI